MLLRRAFPIFALASVLLLAGCYRDSQDSFEPIDSENSGGSSLTPIAFDATATETDLPILIIDPNATEDETAPIETAEVQVLEETPTLRVINPTNTTAPTDEADATSTPQASNTPNVIPTATQASFITPEVNFEATLPTSTATEVVNLPTLEPTPTAFGDEAVVTGACEYEVQNGDNLFRIAISNDVSLDALLAANELTQASIIQPGQILTIPNCDVEETSIAVETEAVEDEPSECEYVVQAGDTLFQIAIDNEIALADLLAENDLTENSILQLEQVLRLPDCEDGEEDTDVSPVETEVVATESSELIHTVVSGETLLSIARRYGVTVNDIIQANNIPNPNNLTVGQQLVIPQE